MKNEFEKRTLGNNKAHKRQQIEENNDCGLNSSAAEVTMNNEKHKGSLGNQKAHKKAAAGGRQREQTDAPNHRGDYEE